MTKPISLTFIGSQSRKLAAILDTPEMPPRAYAIFAHCFTCSKEIKVAHWFGRVLANQGIAVLRFDFAGLGGSEGNFAETNLSTNVEDLAAAIAFLRKRGHAPQLLIGHSLGGIAALVTASVDPDIAAVATIATPAHASHLRTHLIQTPGTPPETFEANISGRPFHLRRQLIEDLESYELRNIVPNLNRPLLLLHDPQDTVVPIEHAETLFDLACQPKSLVTLAGAGHLFIRRDDAQAAAEIVTAWFLRMTPSANPHS